MKEDTAGWVEAEVGMALEPTDIIRCADNSSAEITFLNGDTVELDAGTELEIAELVVSTDTDSAIIRLKLVIGSIVFRVVNIVDPASVYEVETPTGEVAVRGSAVRITISEDRTTLVCNLEGDIWAIAQGVELQIPEGECCVIGSGQPPQLVVVFPDLNLEAAIREEIGKPTGDVYSSDLHELTSLNATERAIADLTGLEHATGLTFLYLWGNQITDISPLADLTGLELLWLHNNQIADISPLTHLANLQELTLIDNQIDDVSPLANVTSLVELDLSRNQICDVSPLANLTNLTYLDLHTNQVRDISPLASLSGLTILALSQNQISDLSPLANLTDLWLLTGRENQITDVSPLVDLTNLEILWIRGNQINDISPLANLTNLGWLELHNNQISDISPLIDNEGLAGGDTVTLQGNPLSSDSINIYIPQLEARGVSVSY
jgi:hypothetical protein